MCQQYKGVCFCMLTHAQDVFERVTQESYQHLLWRGKPMELMLKTDFGAVWRSTTSYCISNKKQSKIHRLMSLTNIPACMSTPKENKQTWQPGSSPLNWDSGRWNVSRMEWCHLYCNTRTCSTAVSCASWCTLWFPVEVGHTCPCTLHSHPLGYSACCHGVQTLGFHSGPGCFLIRPGSELGTLSTWAIKDRNPHYFYYLLMEKNPLEIIIFFVLNL